MASVLDTAELIDSEDQTAFNLAVAVACAELPRFNGLAWVVALPREANAVVTTAGGFFGSCGRTTVSELPLLSSRSGFAV